MLSFYWQIWKFRGHLVFMMESFEMRVFVLGSIQLEWNKKLVSAKADYCKHPSKLRWFYQLRGTTYVWSMQAPITFEKY